MRIYNTINNLTRNIFKGFNLPETGAITPDSARTGYEHEKGSLYKTTVTMNPDAFIKADSDGDKRVNFHEMTEFLATDDYSERNFVGPDGKLKKGAESRMRLLRDFRL